MNKDLVYHPKHYNTDNRKECWDEMNEKFGPVAVAIFDCLSAYKYDYRKGEKAGNSLEQDAEKIKNYMHHSANLIALNSDKANSGMTLAKKVYKIMVEEVLDNE